MVKNISFTNLDFFDNKNALKEYLRSQDRFKIMILKVLILMCC